MLMCNAACKREVYCYFSKVKIKGIVHTKIKILSLISHPHVIPKPVRTSFIFGTQIKILLMKFESFLTLHRQQRNYQVQGPEGSKDIVKIVYVTSVVQP